jgi:hypothetical protein
MSESEHYDNTKPGSGSESINKSLANIMEAQAKQKKMAENYESSEVHRYSIRRHKEEQIKIDNLHQQWQQARVDQLTATQTKWQKIFTQTNRLTEAQRTSRQSMLSVENQIRNTYWLGQ